MLQLAGSLVRYPARVTTTWFALVILIGALLLVAPFSSANAAKPISFLDALFTSTSAVCVTGLAVRSTGNDFTPAGQCVILVLIQIGGIGIMTITTFILHAMAGRSGLRQRAVIASTLGAGDNADLRTILRRVFSTTLIIEGTGIVLLWIRFLFDMNPLTALWQATFHSVSAFCNAGFGLYDDSLVQYQGDLLVNIVIGLLVVFGGIGFPVIIDIWNCYLSKSPLKWDNLHIHTKVTLLGTVILLVGGAVGFLVLEWNGVLEEATLMERILIPCFHSVTCRTAGFNTIDLGQLSNATLFLSIALMTIGAGACSTAGGIKVSTFMMLMIHAQRRFRGQQVVNVFRRTIPQDAIDRAMASVMLFLASGGIALTILLIVEQSNLHGRNISNDVPVVMVDGQEIAIYPERQELFLRALFEVSSALGTVGLSVNFTSTLSPVGRIVIIILMFLGRLGPLSVFAAVSRTSKEAKIHYAHEEPLVG